MCEGINCKHLEEITLHTFARITHLLLNTKIFYRGIVTNSLASILPKFIFIILIYTRNLHMRFNQ